MRGDAGCRLLPLPRVPLPLLPHVLLLLPPRVLLLALLPPIAPMPMPLLLPPLLLPLLGHDHLSAALAISSPSLRHNPR